MFLFMFQFSCFITWVTTIFTHLYETICIHTIIGTTKYEYAYEFFTNTCEQKVKSFTIIKHANFQVFYSKNVSNYDQNFLFDFCFCYS